MVPEIIQRLKDRVAALGGRVEGAEALAHLMKQGAYPTTTPTLHLLPAGITGGKETAFSGPFRQEITRQISLILTVRTHDATGARAMPRIAELIDAIVLAVAGWAPTPDTGVFRFIRAGLTRFETGTAVYEITFALPDQLRITP